MARRLRRIKHIHFQPYPILKKIKITSWGESFKKPNIVHHSHPKLQGVWPWFPRLLNHPRHVSIALHEAEIKVTLETAVMWGQAGMYQDFHGCTRYL